MSELSAWIDDEPPTASESPRFNLPRLHIIHLMMWMAVTAIVFLPYRAQREIRQRAAGVAAQRQESPGTLTRVASYRALMGAQLFVAAALLTWHRRGYRGPLQPGHSFAFRGAAYWLASTVFGLLTLFTLDDPLGWQTAYTRVRGVLELVLIIWFLMLARRPDWPSYWRQSFAAAALVPILISAAMFAFAPSFRGSPAGLVAWQALRGGGLVLISIILGRALYIDYRDKAPRHWSHWIGAGAGWAESASNCVLSFAIWFNPPTVGS
jgi:hypothetical protein